MICIYVIKSALVEGLEIDKFNELRERIPYQKFERNYIIEAESKLNELETFVFT